MKESKSTILAKIDNLIRENLNQGFQDIKILTMLLHFLANSVSTGKEFTSKVLKETCYMESLIYIHENVK